MNRKRVINRSLPLFFLIYPEASREMSWSYECVHDIAKNNRNIVLKIIAWQGLTKRDRPSAKDGTIFWRSEICHVRTNPIILRST